MGFLSDGNQSSSLKSKSSVSDVHVGSRESLVVFLGGIVVWLAWQRNGERGTTTEPVTGGLQQPKIADYDSSPRP